jgi:Family of unknown function (DUF6998)
MGERAHAQQEQEGTRQLVLVTRRQALVGTVEVEWIPIGHPRQSIQRALRCGIGSRHQMSYDPAKRSKEDLLADWAAVMRELRVRDVVRTNNNPVGDIAEAIVAAHYKGERGSFSQAGWDVKAPDGERIQVKAMRQTPTNKRRNVSPIRDRDYDSVVIVIFNENFQVTEGLRLARATVEELFEHKAWMQTIPRPKPATFGL